MRIEPRPLSLFVVCVTLTFGCNRDRAADNAATYSVTSGPTATTQNPSGKLGQSIGQYNADVAQFIALVNGLQWTGADTADRPAVGGGTTRMIMTSVSDGNGFNPAFAGQYGAILLKLENRGSAQDLKYGTNPGSTNFLVVSPWTTSPTQPTGRGAAPWSVVEMIPTGPTRGVRVVKSGGNYSVCVFEARKPNAEVSFGGCAKNAAGTFQHLQGPLTGDDWYSCDEGCCTTGDGSLDVQ